MPSHSWFRAFTFECMAPALIQRRRAISYVRYRATVGGAGHAYQDGGGERLRGALGRM